MARFAYFADLPDGRVLEWRDGSEYAYTDRMGCKRYREVRARVGLFIPNFPQGAASGNVLCGYDPTLGRVAVTRRVELKSNPSRHECNAKCMFAKGKTMACECACGGVNHGRGAFVCA